MKKLSKVTFSLWAIFLIFLRLGLTSFGGPIAHLAYFREEFVSRRQWMNDQQYADLVALCQLLPGATSSQVGFVIGLSRSGYAGALAAWMGFTLPSAILMLMLALGVSNEKTLLLAGVIDGLKVVVVAVVTQAVWGMARSLCIDATRTIIMLLSTGFAVLFSDAWAQVVIMVFAAVMGVIFIKPKQDVKYDALPLSISPRTALFALGLFMVLLLGLKLMALVMQNPTVAMLDVFYRAGSLLFGGGHVVLPLLQVELVSRGWISNDIFLTGYAATQAMPGPLLSFAAFLGACINTSPNGWIGAMLCLIAIFTPSFLLVLGLLTFWSKKHRNVHVQAALLGVGVGMVGLLLATLYNPLWTSTVHSLQDFYFVLMAVVALVFFKIPPWLMVLGCGMTGWVLV